MAYHLAKMGRKVLLVDMGQPASGTTSRSTALVRTHYSNEIVARMAVYSLGVLRNFGKIGQSGFVNSGMVFLGDHSLKDGMERISSSLSKLGVKTESLDPIAAAERFPDLDFSGIDFVDFEPESGYADSVGVATSYASKARQLGAEEIFGALVRRLELDAAGRMHSIEFVDGSSIHCSKAVLCTNVWTNSLLGNTKHDASLPMWASAHPVAVLRRPKGYEGVRVIVADLENKTYYKPEGKSLFLVGSLDPKIDQKKIDPENCPSDVSFEFLSFYAESASRRIPAMKDGVLHSSYIGMYDMTPDQHPIVDELSEMGLENVYCCVGLSGHGFKLCPALGLMVAEIAAGSTNHTFDPSYFALSRFTTGRLLQSKYVNIGTIA